jgi:large subunit ribosomal protein L5
MAKKMRDIKVNKIVINIGTGNEEQKLGNAVKLVEMITGRTPMSEIAKRRIPTFGITKGQKIGAFVTVRGKSAIELAKRLLDAVENRVKMDSITNNSLSFGIKEYIDISGVKYDPKIGMLGMNVNLSFKRAGLRVAIRKRGVAKVSDAHRIVTEEEVAEYLKKQFNVIVE